MRRGDEPTQVAEWLYQALTTSQDLADALGVDLEGLPDRVWPDVAPAGTDAPWVVYSTVEARDALALGDTPRAMTTVPVNVRIITKGADPSAAAPAARVLYALLHGARNVPVADGGMILTARRTQALAYPEDAGGISYRHTGGIFTVEVN